ncbi:DNA topoisomerase III [Yersinia ruckeri]|nr:DNA topoisomerase III [Yersinia ruckeri]
MNNLYIAEKPSLAKAIVDGLVANSGNAAIKKNGYYEIGDDIVSYCVGHLLVAKEPDEVNPDYKRWDMSILPMKLTPIQLKPVKRTEAQLNVVKSLLPKAKNIINAGDPDDEGQLLVDEVLEFYGYNPDANNVLRVLINDVNLKPVQAKLNDLRNNRDYAYMRHTAQARAGADFVYGMNLTRGYTISARQGGYEGVLSVGRVQTVVLGMIVKRYRANKSFKPAYFYKVFARIDIGGTLVNLELTPPDEAPVDDKGRIIDEQYANDLIQLIKGKSARVVSVDESIKKKEPERPLSLLKLSVRMGNIADMESEDVLNIVQSLYETHKASSYPRTDNRYMSEAQWQDAENTFKTICQLSPEMEKIVNLANPQIKSKAVNDKKLSAHTAIIPVITGNKVLNKKELAVYNEIARYYLAQFMPTKDIASISAEFDIDGFSFISKCSHVINAGWSIVLSGDLDEDDNDGVENISSDIFNALKSLSTNDVVIVKDAGAEKGVTTAPELYTSASLMNDLPHVRKYVEDPELREVFKKRDKERGEEGAGIGTPATRPSILPKLKNRGFYEVSKKKLIPTKTGEDFFDALPSIIVNPDITALWSIEQDKIVLGEITVDDFISGIEKFVSEQIEIIKNGSMKIAVYECPTCSKAMRKIKGSKGEFWACTGYRDTPKCETTLADFKGEPDYSGKAKAAAEAKKVKDVKSTTCPKCKRMLKRLKDKKEEGKYYWACEGVFDAGKPCKTFYPDVKGKPELKKKS